MYDIFWVWKLKLKIYGVLLAIILGMVILLALFGGR